MLPSLLKSEVLNMDSRGIEINQDFILEVGLKVFRTSLFRRLGNI